jgi:predicted nucleotidyltransferase
MPERLYWNTVTPLLRSTLTDFMNCELFEPFRLVGGTSLSLQLGHRRSDDIDLFTEAPYGSVDFNSVDIYLRETFSYVSDPSSALIGAGRSYLLGHSKDDAVKVDLYYTDPFIQPPLVLGPFRMATIEEIIAMKIDVVQRGGRKKDFWDLHELLDDYSPMQMIGLHAHRYPYNHDESAIRVNFTEFTRADRDFDPICQRGKYWELIKLDIVERLATA